MAKYEIDGTDAYLRELKRIGAKTMAIKGLVNAEGMGRATATVVLTCVHTIGNREDFYVCSETITSKEVSNQDEYGQLYAELEKRVSALIEEIKKQLPACYIIRGRVIL